MPLSVVLAFVKASACYRSTAVAVILINREFSRHSEIVGPI